MEKKHTHTQKNCSYLVVVDAFLIHFIHIHFYTFIPICVSTETLKESDNEKGDQGNVTERQAGLASPDGAMLTSTPQAHSISPYPNSSGGFRPPSDQVGVTSFSSLNQAGEAANTVNSMTSPKKAPPPEYGAGGSVPPAPYVTTSAEMSTTPNYSSGNENKCKENVELQNLE